MKLKRIYILLFAPLILFFLSQSNSPGADFSYKKILKNEFKSLGSVIPVTIEQPIETDGDFTKDGEYMFYTSNRDRGNFNIYLRSLGDIISFKITGHASKDTSPAISPDMKYLAFVSEREDPEGDIFVVEVDPEELIKKAAESVTEVPPLDPQAENISLFQDPDTKIIKIIKDASPCWSPDSNRIAFSSTRDGTENIWIMDRDGDNKVQLTAKGGMYPRFSMDGEKIIYISYKDKGGNGNVYIIDIKTGKETAVTNTAAIELHPTFMGNNYEIVYTLIDRDTNRDGKIDLKDNSILYYKNLKSGTEYPLTLYSRSSFSPRWSGAYTVKYIVDGIIIYSNLEGDNININIIPDTGIIPVKKRDSARRFYQIANKYLNELDDRERYLMALEKMYYVYGKKKDTDSRIYVSRALMDAAKIYSGLGEGEDARRMHSMLSSLSGDEKAYSSIMSKYLSLLLEGKDGVKLLLEKIDAISGDSKRKGLVPYLMEDLGDEYSRTEKTDKAVETYETIIDKFPDYKREIYAHYKLARLKYQTLRDYLLPSDLKILESSYYFEKIATTNRLLDIYSGEKNLKRRLSIAKGMLDKYKDKKEIVPLLQYVSGRTLFQIGDYEGAKTYLSGSLKLLREQEMLFYKSNILLGKIAEKEKKFPEMEKHFHTAAVNYDKAWKQPDYRAIVERLINYYEEYGERADYSGDYGESKELYSRYVWLCNYLHLRKIFGDVYNENAPRAHVLYIDAYAKLNRFNTDALLKLEGRYREGVRGHDFLSGGLPVARMDLNKAYIYGLGYIYTLTALSLEENGGGALPDITAAFRERETRVLEFFQKAVGQTEWALFMDDTFIDPDILKGWIYQYIDLKRKEDLEKTGGEKEPVINKYFPQYLWEKNITIYEKAIKTNDENAFPGKEGNLHLNMGNSYFLLNNFPRAFTHYKLAKKYKKSFNSKIEEAIFYYHLGYCYWQNNEPGEARDQMMDSLRIYRFLASGRPARYKKQIFYLYKYFALFERAEKNYREAIKWYTTLLDFSSRYKIKTDRARFLQEIAFCYKELGEDAGALQYLKRAEKLLRKYEPGQKEYPLGVGILGFVSFPLMDLGVDSVVVGDSRINSELNTKQKKLLNISLEEDIHSAKGNLDKAVKNLDRKLSLLEGADTKFDRAARLRALNNKGFYFFRMRKFEKAEEFFKKAWDYAANPDVNDIEAVFVSILNNVHLLAFMLENGLYSMNDPSAEIDSLINKINEYRESYEKNRFEAEMKKLQEEAEAEKREIKSGEIEELKKRIAAEAEEKYFSLEIAVGILTYHKAELKRLSGIRGKNTVSAYSYYSFNRELCGLYSEAINKFETGLEKSGTRQSKKMYIKLLMNISECRLKTGQIDEAYTGYGKAEKLAEQYEYTDLAWRVYYHTARLLMKFGRDIEGGEYLKISEEYFIKAAAIIEEYPFLFSDNIFTIKELYDDYTALLIKVGKHEKALAVSETGYEISRLTSVILSSADFHNEKDRAVFNNYMNIANNIARIQKEISALRENGAMETDFEIKSLKNEINNESNKLKEIIKKTGKRSPVFASLISLSSDKVTRTPGAVIFKFYERDDSLYSWIISSGRIDFKKIDSGSRGDRSAAGAASGIISKAGDAKQRFVVSNKTSIRLLQKPAYDSPGFMFIPSIRRAAYYISPSTAALNNIYFNGTGIEEKIAGIKGITIDEGTGGNIDLKKYSVLIDNINELTPGKLLSIRLEPSLLVKKIYNGDADNISFLSEAALYSGIKSLVLIDPAASIDALARLIREVQTEPFDSAIRKSLASTKSPGIGFRGYKGSEREAKLTLNRETEYRMFRDSLMRGDAGDAYLHLNKWHNIHAEDMEKNKALYYQNASEIELLKGNYAESLDFAIKSSAISENRYKELYLKSLSSRIYLSLYNGDMEAADSLLSGNIQSGTFQDTADYMVYKSIAGFVSGASPPSDSEYKKIISMPAILPVNSIKLLYARYLQLLGAEKTAESLLRSWEPDYPVPESDALIVYLLNHKASNIISLEGRAEEIAALLNKTGDMGNLKNRAVLLLEYEGNYDALTPFAALFTIRNFINNKNSEGALSFIEEIDFDEILARSHWSDSTLLLSLCRQVSHGEKRYEQSIEYVRRMLSAIKEKGIPSLMRKLYYTEASTLTLLERYSESYKSALTGFDVSSPDSGLEIKYELLLMENEIFLGKINEAKAREEKIKSSGRPEYLYILYLLKSRIELLKIINKQKASPADWKTVEEHIRKALGILDETPDVLNRMNRIDIVKEILNILISYKMSINKTGEAILFSEIKKQLELRSRFPYLADADSIPESAVSKFKNTKDGAIIAGLLNEHPYLQINALAGTIPIEQFQNKIPADSIVFYLASNADDILGMAISKNEIAPLRIKDGFLKAKDIEKNYRENLLLMKNTIEISKELYNLFRPLAKYYKNIKTIIFITDSELESIPFEIMGERDMLEESHGLIYLSSILSSFVAYNDWQRSVNTIDASDKNIFHELELISIKESGINYKKKASIKGGIGHLYGKILLDPSDGRLYAGDSILSNLASNYRFLYIPAFDFRERISYNEFVAQNSLKGVKGVILNDAEIHDLNNAVFIDNFYSKIREGESLIKAFQGAKEALRGNKKYSYPSYWAGIRLYLNGF